MSFSKTVQDRHPGAPGPGRSAPEGEEPPTGIGAPRGRTRGTAGGRPSLGLLFATVFLDLVGFGIVIPLLPLYALRFGAGPVAVTMLVAVYSLMQFLFAPWWGQLSDRVGRRPVLLVGLFGSAASYLLFGLAGSLVTLFAGRILAGVGGATIGVAQAYVADVTRPADRAKGMGMIGAAFGLGFIFGPALGGILARYGATVPFFVAAGLTLLNGLLALRWLPESRLPQAGAAAESQAGIGARWRALSRLRHVPGVGRLFAAFFLMTFAFAALEATMSLWADRRWHFTPSQVAYLFAYLGVLVTLVQGGLVGALARRLGERGLAILGMVSFTAALVGIALAPSLPVLAGALALLALGQGAAGPALSALISRTAPAAERGRVLGISQSLSALGRVLGPVWGGLALSRLGLGAPYLSGAAFVMLGLGIFLAGSPRPAEGG